MKKNKFRLLSTILVLMLIIGTFTGCTKSSTQEPSQDTATTETTETAEVPDGTEELQEIYDVNIGITPYSMYQVFTYAKETGLDKKFGLNFSIKPFTGTSTGAQALTRGDMDISAACIAEHLSAVKGSPTLKNFGPVGYFKGFFFVGRSDAMKEWSQLVEETGDIKTAKEQRLNEFKGKTFMIIPQRKALILDAIAQVGLTEADVKFMNFADDQKAATAFLSGTGDIYIGSLPQQRKLVRMEEFIDIGGSDILGPAGLWYDTMMATDKFMINNREAAIRTLAVMLTAAKEFDDNSQKFAEIAAANLTQISGSEFAVEEYLEFQTKYDDLISLKEATDGFYNKDSELYWKHAVDYNIELLISEGTLDDSVTSDGYYGESEKLFMELLQREDLLQLMNN